MIHSIDPQAIIQKSGNNTKIRQIGTALTLSGSSGLNLNDKGGYRLSDDYSTSSSDEMGYGVYWSNTENSSNPFNGHALIIGSFHNNNQSIQIYSQDNQSKIKALNCRCVKD